MALRRGTCLLSTRPRESFGAWTLEDPKKNAPNSRGRLSIRPFSLYRSRIKASFEDSRSTNTYHCADLKILARASFSLSSFCRGGPVPYKEAPHDPAAQEPAAQLALQRCPALHSCALKLRVSTLHDWTMPLNKSLAIVR